MNSFVEESRLRLCLLVPLPHSALRLEVSLPLACRVRDFRDQFPRGFHGWARHPPAAGAAQASGTDAHPRRIMKNKLDRMPNPQTLDDRSASAASRDRRAKPMWRGRLLLAMPWRRLCCMLGCGWDSHHRGSDGGGFWRARPAATAPFAVVRWVGSPLPVTATMSCRC